MKKFLPLVRVGLVATLALSAVVVLSESQQAESAAPNKVTICHRTSATSNPYRRITVNKNSVNSNGGHRTPHAGNGPYDPDGNVAHRSNLGGWGDIIPPSSEPGGQNGIDSLNWTSVGQAIFRGTGAGAGRCGRMTTKAFYDLEVAAGEAPADVLREIFESTATEDDAIVSRYASLSAFTTAMTNDPTLMASQDYSVTTAAATSVSTSGAVLNGQFSLNPSGPAAVSFEWGTDSSCVTGTSVNGSPATVSGPGASSAAVSGLASGERDPVSGPVGPLRGSQLRANEAPSVTRC